MESDEFIQYCKEKFEYLEHDYGFKIVKEVNELLKPYILFEKII